MRSSRAIGRWYGKSAGRFMPSAGLCQVGDGPACECEEKQGGDLIGTWDNY